MSTLPRVLSWRDLPAVELQAARLDGEVFGIADAYCPIDEFEQPRHRAAAVLATRSRRLVAELGTAAWIWGTIDERPGVLELCARLGARARLAPNALVTVREVVIDDDEILELGEVRVTSPLRTAVDLARFRRSFGAAEGVVTRRLAEIGGFTLADALALMDRRANLHHKRLAATRLRRVEFGAAQPAWIQPALTRYTS